MSINTGIQVQLHWNTLPVFFRRVKAVKRYVSVTVDCTPQRAGCDKAAGIDWGLEAFATLAETGGRYDSVDNPRFINKDQRQRLKTLQQAVSRKTNNLATPRSSSWPSRP
jgi:transposase